MVLNGLAFAVVPTVTLRTPVAMLRIESHHTEVPGRDRGGSRRVIPPFALLAGKLRCGRCSRLFAKLLLDPKFNLLTFDPKTTGRRFRLWWLG